METHAENAETRRKSSLNVSQPVTFQWFISGWHTFLILASHRGLRGFACVFDCMVMAEIDLIQDQRGPMAAGKGLGPASCWTMAFRNRRRMAS